jgi:hypothetical protein
MNIIIRIFAGSRMFVVTGIMTRKKEEVEWLMKEEEIYLSSREEERDRRFLSFFR